jgi:hypothetical protein
VNDRPLLCICVPTYNRAPLVARLLEALEREIREGDDVVVIIADNASPDATPELLAAAQARLPWLRVHRQPENIGPFANTQWLIEHAPPAEYLWTFGDDDLLFPGALARTLDLLREHRPAWLFHPYNYIDADGVVSQGTPAHGVAQLYPGAAALWHDWHQYLTFFSASVLRADALRDAARATSVQNAYLPLLWFFRAALDGPCVVAGEHGINCCTDIGWADVAHEYQTLHYTSLYDDGLHVGLSEEEFGVSLNGLYKDGFGDAQWRRVPIERLAAAVLRFPQCASLRRLLWEIAREQGRRDVLADLAAACATLGLEVEAQEARAAGEEAFAAGRHGDAARLFDAAAGRVPTLPGVWNDLAVALHLCSSPAARAALDVALWVDPDDADALANLRAMTAVISEPGGAGPRPARQPTVSR